MYTSIPYPEFLTSNLLITHENFVDYEDESSKSQECSPRRRTSGPTSASRPWRCSDTSAVLLIVAR